MNIQIKLYANLAKFLPEGSKDKQATLSIEEGATVRKVLELLGIPTDKAHLIFVNSAHKRGSATALSTKVGLCLERRRFIGHISADCWWLWLIKTLRAKGFTASPKSLP